jgi:predicted S18 family serine protease
MSAFSQQGLLGRPRDTPPIDEARRAKIEMYKVQFITEKLNLTKAEAELFWPVYNEAKKNIDELVKTKMNDEIQFEENILAIKKKLKAELKPILKSEERVNEALKIEREFLKNLRGEMMRRKGFRA